MSAEQSTTTETVFADPTGLFKFRQQAFIVFEQDNEQYICLKDLVKVIGLQWKSARQTAINGDNAVLYGTIELNLPEMAALATTSGTRKALGIKLACVPIYLARINTNHVRAKSSSTMADALLALQQEWAQVLYLYESGESISKAKLNDQRSLVSLINAQKNACDEHREAISNLITTKLKSMGCKTASVQSSLEV